MMNPAVYAARKVEKTRPRRHRRRDRGRTAGQGQPHAVRVGVR